MSIKNSNATIGNRTRDLPVCSAVPKPTALPRPPIIIIIIIIIIIVVLSRTRNKKPLRVNGLPI